MGLVYPTAQVRDETVVAFVGDGLRLGEHVVLDTWDQGWESALAQHGVDTRRSAEDGSLTALAAPHFFPAGWALPQTLYLARASCAACTRPDSEYPRPNGSGVR